MPMMDPLGCCCSQAARLRCIHTYMVHTCVCVCVCMCVCVKKARSHQMTALYQAGFTLDASHPAPRASRIQRAPPYRTCRANRRGRGCAAEL